MIFYSLIIKVFIHHGQYFTDRHSQYLSMTFNDVYSYFKKRVFSRLVFWSTVDRTITRIPPVSSNLRSDSPFRGLLSFRTRAAMATWERAPLGSGGSREVRHVLDMKVTGHWTHPAHPQMLEAGGRIHLRIGHVWAMFQPQPSASLFRANSWTVAKVPRGSTSQPWMTNFST